MRAYLWMLAASLSASIVGVAITNVTIDPYRIFGTREIAGLNAVKARAGQRGELTKRYAAYLVRPNAVILGNSRAEVGFDPLHTAWPTAVQPVVNMAVPGTDVRSAVQMLAYAIDAGAPKIVVAGLDFLDFRLDASQAPPNRGDAVARPLIWQTKVRDYINVAISLDALYDSTLTVASQAKRYSAEITRLGFNPMRDYVEIASREGYGSLFAQKDRENALNYLRRPKEVVYSNSNSSPDFEDVRSLIKLARAAGARTHLVIYPYHAHILELLELTGLWSSFERWKAILAGLVEEEIATDISTTPVTLWDFSGYTQYATERVPEIGDLENGVKWYWEAGHFKKQLGDRVLDRILEHAKEDDVRRSFGAELSSQNVQEHLQSIRSDRERYRAAHRDELLRLQQLVDRLKVGEGNR